MLYLHIPFCRQACHYCNFHFSTSLKHEDEMIEAICLEIKQRSGFPFNTKELDSVYFGGGTPSIISQENLKKIFASIHNNFSILPEAEITLEANPEDINLESLSHWKKQGINRLSIGVQSFHNKDLKWMNRIHDSDKAVEALGLLKDFDMDYSLDLIFGSPHTTNDIWANNLRKVIDLKPDHISCYALTVEDNTSLDRMIKLKKELPIDQEKAHQQFYMAHDMLTQNEYVHYEISNYCLPNKRATHNSNYWRSRPYLGVGPSAHSFDGNNRSWNIANNAAYLKNLKLGLPVHEQEILTEKDHYNEFAMTRLRTMEGIDLQEIESRFPNYATFAKENIQSLIDKGLLEKKNTHIRLVREAMIIADQVCSELFYVD